MKNPLPILAALLLASLAATHAAELVLLRDGKSDYQIVVPDTLATPALTDSRRSGVAPPVIFK